METFSYKAVADNGRVIDGKMRAEDERSVIRKLQADGLLPISASLASGSAGAMSFTRRWLAWRQRVSRSEVTALLSELATLLGAGIPLDGSLQRLCRSAGSKRLQKVVRVIEEDVQSGRPLSDSLAAHGDVFDALTIQILSAGEASGKLDQALTQAADYRERSEALRADVVSSLTYPAILVAVSVLSLFVLMTFVVPQFTELFEDAEATLPTLSLAVFSMANAMSEYWWLIVLAFIAGLVVVDRQLKRPETRARCDGALLQLPLIGELIRFTNTARTATTLKTLLRSGLTLTRALTLAGNLPGNAVMRKALIATIDDVKQGIRLSAALEAKQAIPRFAIDLVAIGEETGALDEAFRKIGETYEEKTRKRVKVIMTLLEPAIIVGLGVVIALVIVSILMAMLGINDLVGISGAKILVSSLAIRSRLFFEIS